VNLAAVTFFLLSYGPHGVSFGPYHIDLDVYRIGGRAWLDGRNLYGRLPATQGGARLPFTYPPIAAVLVSPLSLLPMTVAGTVLTVCSIALLALVLRIFLPSVASPTGSAGSAGQWRRAILWLLPPALFLEPVRNTLLYGQINIVLMALVSLDCLTSAPRWPRGAMVGLAAAIKLTPAAFVLFFLLRRDFRAAAMAGLSFAIATGAGSLLAWQDSIRYWTSVMLHVGRIGNVIYAGNQCIQAVLARAGLDPRSAGGTLVWLALSAVVLVAACLGMRRAFAASEQAWALSLNALAALLVSPISWSHHWVWIVPALLVLGGLGRRYARWPFAATAIAGLVVFAVGAQWWFPSGSRRELRWAFWEQVIGSSYVIFAVLVVLVFTVVRLSPASAPQKVLAPSRSGDPVPLGELP
jgi:alpha-1,2-mannosyltransferase